MAILVQVIQRTRFQYMNERTPWYFKFKKFTGPVIMSGRDFYEHKDNLVKQVEELLSIDSGLAQPCHCEEERAYWTKEREGLANNIKTALML
jgi:hypothetical protein